MLTSLLIVGLEDDTMKKEQTNTRLPVAVRSLLDAELDARQAAGWSGTLGDLIAESVQFRLRELGWVVGDDGRPEQVAGERISEAERRRQTFLRVVEQALGDYEDCL